MCAVNLHLLSEFPIDTSHQLLTGRHVGIAPWLVTCLPSSENSPLLNEDYLSGDPR